jgi:hypothetical protein
MIVKFFKSSGSGKALADYLEAEQVHQRDPVTGRTLYDQPKISRDAPPEPLRGSFAEVVALSETLGFARTYKAGVIAFDAGDNPSPEQIQAVIDDFQRHSMAGLDQDRACWAWNLHRDKGNIELNFMVSNVDLDTGRFLNIAPPGHEAFFNAWRDLKNLENGWASPSDPARQQEFKTPRGEAKTRVQTKELIHANVTALLDAGLFEPNRAGVLEALKTMGEITRPGNDYISIRLPDEPKPYRLKGGIYAADFNGSSEAIAAAARTRQPSREKQLDSARGEVERAYASRARHFQSRYRKQEELATGEPDRVAADRFDPLHGLGHGRGLGLVEAEPPLRNRAIPRQWQVSANESAERRLPEHVPDTSRRTALQATGAISHDRISRSKISLSHLRESPANGLREGRGPNQERGFLSLDWQAIRRGFADPVQRLQAYFKHSGGIDDRDRKGFASSIRQGFERLGIWRERSDQIVQRFDSQSENLAAAGGQLERHAAGRSSAGASIDAALQRFGRAVGNLEHEIEHNQALNPPSRSRGMSWGL